MGFVTGVAASISLQVAAFPGFFAFPENTYGRTAARPAFWAMRVGSSTSLNLWEPGPLCLQNSEITILLAYRKRELGLFSALLMITWLIYC